MLGNAQHMLPSFDARLTSCHMLTHICHGGGRSPKVNSEILELLWLELGLLSSAATPGLLLECWTAEASA